MPPKPDIVNHYYDFPPVPLTLYPAIGPPYSTNNREAYWSMTKTLLTPEGYSFLSVCQSTIQSSGIGSGVLVRLDTGLPDPSQEEPFVGGFCHLEWHWYLGPDDMEGQQAVTGFGTLMVAFQRMDRADYLPGGTL